MFCLLATDKEIAILFFCEGFFNLGKASKFKVLRGLVINPWAIINVSLTISYLSKANKRLWVFMLAK